MTAEQGLELLTDLRLLLESLIGLQSLLVFLKCRVRHMFCVGLVLRYWL
jgi:hypothetical protein